jgi:hypothetical protein
MGTGSKRALAVALAAASLLGSTAAPAADATPASAGGDEGVIVASGIGLGGLAVAAVAGGVGLDEPSTETYVLGGVGLGIALLGFSTAGILAVSGADEDPAVSLVFAPSGGGLTVSF